VVETHYVKSGEVSLAYRVYGEGEPTLLHVPGAISNITMEELTPPIARYFEHISRFCRVVRFDKRGTGLSDRSGTALTLADQIPDVEAVQHAVEAERVALYGLSQGAAVAVLYALAHPERVSHLILVEGLVSDARDPREPRSAGNELFDWNELFADIDHDFGAFSRRFGKLCFPIIDEEGLGGIVELLRGSASPSAFRSLLQGIVGLDLRPRLKEVSVPTLVVHASGDQIHPVEHGRYLAAHVPSARYVELDSDAHVPYVDDAMADQMVAAIEEFLTGSVVHSAERRFATILFTDIVDSTARQQRSGDEAWRGILTAHHADSARIVEQFGGRIVEVLGDGVLAAFDAPGEGLRAARSMLAAARSRGIQLRAGLQAGEVYELGDRLLGICVNMAARVAAEAASDEILTTELVQGLVDGSGFAFSEAGEFELKGLGRRRLVRLL
jgi:pimeloyl-ACP methyl ester carboxylesterase